MRLADLGSGISFSPSNDSVPTFIMYCGPVDEVDVRMMYEEAIDFVRFERAVWQTTLDLYPSMVTMKIKDRPMVTLTVSYDGGQNYVRSQPLVYRDE